MPKLFFLAILMFAFSCKQNKRESLTSIKSFDEKTELEAIMQTIEAETKCFYERDYDCWKEHFIQADYALQAWNNEDGTFDVMASYDSIAHRAKNYFIKYPVKEGETASHEKVIRKNMVSKFFCENVCYLFWDQYNIDNKTKKYTLSKDERIMEKVDGKWKIVNVSSYWDYKNPRTDAEF